MIAENSIVEFINPLPDEMGIIMLVLEVNGDRLLVEYLVGMEINPSGIVATNEVKEHRA